MTYHTAPDGHRYASGSWAHQSGHTPPDTLAELGRAAVTAISLAIGMAAIITVAVVGPQLAAVYVEGEDE